MTYQKLNRQLEQATDGIQALLGYNRTLDEAYELSAEEKKMLKECVELLNRYKVEAVAA